MSSGITTTVSPSSSCLLFKSARAAMSSRKGSGNTRTRKPAHQNSFAFRHNPKSQKTAKILGMPNTGLCASCHDKVEWRKKYRKYRPLRQPATCNHCHKKAITAAYHKICTPCARERRVCPWCCTKGRPRPTDAEEGHEGEGGEGEEEAEEGGEGGAMEALTDGVDMEDALEEERGGCRESGSGGGREEGTEAAEGKGRVDFMDDADE